MAQASKRLLKSFLDYGLPVPKASGDVSDNGVYEGGELPAEKNITGEVTGEVTGGVTGEVRLEIIRVTKICMTPKSRKELMAKLGLKHEDHFREAYLLPALEVGMIEQTIWDWRRVLMW
ncbi:MAG: hypothetical protein V1844_07615 [Pseudomonadota bacterium]